MKTKQIDFRKHITSDPNIVHGQPCIKGTRIMVSVILGYLGAGASYEELIEAYPSLNNEGRHLLDES